MTLQLHQIASCGGICGAMVIKILQQQQRHNKKVFVIVNEDCIKDQMTFINHFCAVINDCTIFNNTLRFVFCIADDGQKKTPWQTIVNENINGHYWALDALISQNTGGWSWADHFGGDNIALMVFIGGAHAYKDGKMQKGFKDNWNLKPYTTSILVISQKKSNGMSQYLTERFGLKNCKHLKVNNNIY